MFLFCLVFAMFCARLFICALWSPAGKGLTSWFSFVVSTEVYHFPIGILGQVWYLIVSIPDLCILTYFSKTKNKINLSILFFINEHLNIMIGTRRNTTSCTLKHRFYPPSGFKNVSICESKNDV